MLISQSLMAGSKMQLKLAMPQLVLALILTPFFSPPGTVCRYSVRDVGFVNIHGQPWHLRMLRPAGADEAQVSNWQSAVETQLDGTNVTYEWVRSDSLAGKRLDRLFEGRSNSLLPLAAMYGPNDTVFPIRALGKNASDKLEDLLKPVIRSPMRDKVLDQITSALCVILVVESGESAADENALEIANAAANQVSRQMWMMEKPTEVGPVVEVISAVEREQEQWLLKSLGLNPTAKDPQLVIVYGQGRRLGDPLIGKDILESKIAQLAGLCGQSCECELDRIWLYGTQMIHYWGDDRAAKAEKYLNFDPGAALVLAEVNGIVNRASQGNKRSDSLIGNGLVIHDFSEADDAAKQDQQDENSENLLAEVGSQESADHSTKEVGGISHDTPSETDHPDGLEDHVAAPGFWSSRWILLIIAGSIVLAVAFLAVARGRE